MLTSRSKSCLLEHHYLAYLKKQDLQPAHYNRKQESIAYTLQQESYLIFAFEIFASLYVAKLAHFFKHFASLHFVKEVKNSTSQKRRKNLLSWTSQKFATLYDVKFAKITISKELLSQKKQMCYLAYLKIQNILTCYGSKIASSNIAKEAKIC